jgi:hypothetical protein
MSRKHSCVACLAIGAAVILTGCATATPAEAPPAMVVHVPGSQTPQLRLTEHAIQRLGIATGPVRETAAGKAPGGQATRKVIPYSAVVYDTDGSSWTYVNTGATTYQRRPITITVIDGNVAILAAGPPVGARVVTVGAAELLGTEYNISGEE